MYPKLTLICSLHLEVWNGAKVVVITSKPSSFKPIDREVIKKTVERSKMLISIEEHNLIGGLSSALSEELSKINSSPKLISFGAEDFYSKAGTYDYLKETYGLTIGNIVSKISKNYEQLK